MTQTPERHQLEHTHIEIQDYEQTLRWEAFRPDAVAQIKECLEKGGDLRDLLNDLDIHYDEYDSLTDKEVNEFVIQAVRSMK